ncbi:hypothetical protein OHB93_09710 [Microbacterium sp. No. 7]|uniref:hypothetical protein n=1 Tax=Microbacterium sp. No. 7 TaxID=1714373 RepID=UPI003009D6B1
MDMDDSLDDDIVRKLCDAAPTTTAVSERVENELARMTVVARNDQVPAGPDRQRSRRVVIRGAIVGVVLIAGAGAAAANTATSWISSWADTPALEFTYTLPSGSTCESRIGGLELPTGFEDQESEILEYIAAIDVMATIDLDGAIAAARSSRDVWLETDEGVDVPAWYGTEHYPSPDREYSMAVQSGLREVIFEELERRGMDVWSDPGLIRLEGETKCPEAKG